MYSDSPDVGFPNASTAAVRLAAFMAGNLLVTFEEGFPDKEYPYIVCSMWGAIPTNELFVRISNGSQSFVDCTPSPLELPSMADRTAGMDVADAKAASALADRIWERHRHELIRPT
jgi:hypothetical protein